MVNRSLTVQISLWNQAKKKSGITSLSAIIRVLLRKWLNGEITLTAEDYEKYQ